MKVHLEHPSREGGYSRRRARCSWCQSVLLHRDGNPHNCSARYHSFQTNVSGPMGNVALRFQIGVGVVYWVVDAF